MPNDPSKFFMIDGPLVPQGTVESLMVSIAPAVRRAKVKILAEASARNIVKKHSYLRKGFDWNDTEELRADIAAAIEAAATHKSEEI